MKSFTHKGINFNVPDNFSEIKLETQRGSTCGLYALELAMHQLGNNSIPATKNHAKTGAGEDGISLRKIAKQKGVSKLGEMFRAKNMENFINMLDAFKGKKLASRMLPFEITAIEQQIANQGYVLVPFDVCCAWGTPQEGLPCKSAGKDAHWGAIVGFNPDIFLVYHWGDYHQFNKKALLDSNAQLAEFPESFCIKWKCTPPSDNELKQVWDSMSAALGEHNLKNISYSDINNPQAISIALRLLSGKEEFKNDICKIIKINTTLLNTPDGLCGKIVTII